MSEELLCITYFDQIIGPSVFYCNVKSLDDPNFPNLTRILDFTEVESTFIFAFSKYQTLNHIFYTDSEIARGGQDLIMLTYIIKSSYFKNEIVDVFKYLDSKRKVLQNFATELKNLDRFTNILHANKRDQNNLNDLNVNDEIFEKKFLKMYDEYFNVISVKSFEKAVMKSTIKSKKIFILGTPNSGKSTFLKDVEDIQFHGQSNPGLPTKIYEMVIDNIQILSYSCFEQKLECVQCQNLGGCVENAQGFIVVFNLDHQDEIITTRDDFYSIVNSCDLIESEKIPILLIGNKFNDSLDFDEKFIIDSFEFDELESCGMKLKFFPINLIKEKDKLLKALRWMIKHMI